MDSNVFVQVLERNLPYQLDDPNSSMLQQEPESVAREPPDRTGNIVCNGAQGKDESQLTVMVDSVGDTADHGLATETETNDVSRTHILAEVCAKQALHLEHLEQEIARMGEDGMLLQQVLEAGRQQISRDREAYNFRLEQMGRLQSRLQSENDHLFGELEYALRRIASLKTELYAYQHLHPSQPPTISTRHHAAPSFPARGVAGTADSGGVTVLGVRSNACMDRLPPRSVTIVHPTRPRSYSPVRARRAVSPVRVVTYTGPDADGSSVLQPRTDMGAHHYVHAFP